MKAKQLARWIYYEDSNYYCSECSEKRLGEINNNREFSDMIDYENGDECGYHEDYAPVDYHVECCVCSAPLFSLIDA